MLKASQQPGEPEEISCEGSSGDPPGDGAYSDSTVAGASQGLHRGTGRPISSDIIINENLKLLQIHYLARKMDVLIFLLGHIVLVTELMARLCIIILNL
jgi:hypothetical protein